ncbi:5-hydroxymethyl-dUMP N-hydrolase-like [Halichondria panicea]|uniref:5-hydroxymethyl-dUMP N-hydrolase-like n=1 Tax=Halichondria panicea TaxID=6063 RepID=UPI00312B9264
MSLKIYFAGSIRAGRADAHIYAKIVDILKKYGSVLTEHVGNPNMTEKGDVLLTDKEIHDRDVDWLKQSDVLVAEVTQVSLGVGYEIGRAVAMGKKTLCLYRPQPDKRLSAMVRGSADITVVDYSEVQVESILESYFKTFIR